MIELKNIIKVYEGRTVLDINSLHIHRGELIGLVGNNGAGKTTMISLILDLIPATKGFVTSKGAKISKNEEWKKYTGSYLDEGFLISFLSPMEYLVFVAELHQITEEEVETFLAENKSFFSEYSDKKKYIRDLSLGNKNKLGILATFLINPEIIILDEPFANLDPSSQSWLKKKLKTLNDKGMTIIISSHDLNHITDTCQRILLIENGKIIEDVSTSNDTLKQLEHYFDV